MPVQFQCPACRTLLSVGSKKAGQSIQCPKCSATVIVPGGLAEPEGAPPPGTKPAETPVHQPAQPGPPHEFAVDTQRKILSEAPLGELSQLPEGKVLISRSLLFFQFVFFVLCVVAAFVGGYVLGQVDAPQKRVTEVEEPKDQPPPGDPVTLEGRVILQETNVVVTPDAGAVVLLFPADSLPDEPLPVVGLAPSQQQDLVHEQSAARLEAFGGAETRANRDGEYSLTVPDQGDYFLLLISKQAERSQAEISESDLALLQRYFEDPRKLIGDQEYFLKEYPLNEPLRSFPPHAFGKD